MKRSLILLFSIFIFAFFSCNGNGSIGRDSKFENRSANQNKMLQNKILELEKSMLDYKKIADPSYSEKDVTECGYILNNYLIEIDNSKSKEQGILITKATIQRLNKLNEKCEHTLIETSEREEIAEIINKASFEKGYNNENEDVTGEWREW